MGCAETADSAQRVPDLEREFPRPGELVLLDGPVRLPDGIPVHSVLHFKNFELPQDKLMNHRIPPIRVAPVCVAALLAFTLVGCDAGTDDTIILNNIRAAFEFEFQGDDLNTGQLQDLTSNGSANITSQLSSLGFTLEEILSAEVIEASIELVVPTFVGSGIDLRAFDEVILQLESGGTVREVASRTGFTSEEPADMNVI